VFVLRSKTASLTRPHEIDQQRARVYQRKPASANVNASAHAMRTVSHSGSMRWSSANGEDNLAAVGGRTRLEPLAFRHLASDPKPAVSNRSGSKVEGKFSYCTK
jgi:hypothetical protein